MPNYVSFSKLRRMRRSFSFTAAVDAESTFNCIVDLGALDPVWITFFEVVRCPADGSVRPSGSSPPRQGSKSPSPSSRKPNERVNHSLEAILIGLVGPGLSGLPLPCLPSFGCPFIPLYEPAPPRYVGLLTNREGGGQCMLA
jgi:hypothetical protein